MNDFNLYENAMQVVPLLLIALFVDNRSLTDTGQTYQGRRWLDLQNRAVAALCLIAFFTSVFVVAKVLPPSGVTNGIVIAALCGSIGLLFTFIWNKFRKAPESPTPDRPQL